MIVKDNQDDFQSYLEDTSNIKGKADRLYIPATVEQLQQLVYDCNQQNIPLTCCGARTGTTAGAVAFEGAILSLEAFDKIISIDSKHKLVTVEAGVSLSRLEQALNRKKLTLRAQPTESLAYIGSAVATNASGVRGFRYGSIRNYVKALEVVLSDGRHIRVPRGKVFAQNRHFNFSLGGYDFDFSVGSYDTPQVKSQAGYFANDNMDLIDLFIGSEGTLGIIVSLEIEVQKLVENIFDGVIFFHQEDEGFDFINRVKHLKKESKVNPTSLEFLDKNSLDFLKEKYPSIELAQCAVYFEQEVDNDEDKDFLVTIWTELIEVSGADFDMVWFGDTAKEREKIFEFRHSLPQLINEFLREHKQAKLSADIAVPEDEFSQMYDFYKQKAKETKVHFVNFGHVGECHLHFNFLPKDDDEYMRAKKAITECVKKAVSLGGTVSAEHGIGKIKKDYLQIMYGKDSVNEMIAIKRYFDPKCILGRDNLFDKELVLKK